MTLEDLLAASEKKPAWIRLDNVVAYLRAMACEASVADSPQCGGAAWLHEAANRIEGKEHE